MKRRRSDKPINHFYMTIILAAVVLLTIGGGYVVQANSCSTVHCERVKYYKSIEVQPGDSLWSIAREYRPQEFSSIYAYMQDIYTLNHLTSDSIIAGTCLMITCYSDVDSDVYIASKQ